MLGRFNRERLNIEVLFFARDEIKDLRRISRKVRSGCDEENREKTNKK